MTRQEPRDKWAIQLLDTSPQAACVVKHDGTFLFANRTARDVLRRKGGRLCAPFLEHVHAVLADRRPREQAVVTSPGQPGRWVGRFWPLDDGEVAFVGEWVPERKRAAEALALRLGIDIPDARLALAVAEGLSNRDIAARLAVTPGTIASRVWRLCRKLGLRRRAELAALVASLRTTLTSAG